MNNSLWVAKTGLDAQQTRMTVISNNLANASTTGFKRDRANFEDTLYQTVRQPGGASSEQTALPTGMQVGTGSRVVSTSKLFTQGGLNQTGNPLDIAINGRGFIEVMMPDGTSAYTRDGGLSKNSEGELVTSAGYQIQPGIVIPETADNLTIGRDGTITARDSATNTETVIGQLTLTDFINPTGLQAIGENLFRETAASGPPNNSQAGVNGMGLIVQNALEGSNVNVVEELVGMIEAQRAYETNAKAISTSDAMLGFLNQTL